MQKANPLVELIEQIVNEEVDKALALSDKRRKEFKKTFSDVFTEVDSLNIGRSPLNLEADATSPPPAAPTATAPAPAPAAPAPAGTSAAPATGDPAAPATGADPLAGAAPGVPGDPAATGVDATGTDPAAAGADATGMDAGGALGGLGGVGGAGGGGGGGGGGDDTTGGAEGGEETPGEEGGAGEEEPVGDPIDAMVSGAQELLSQTQDPNLILKSLKGQIQTVFKEPEHALGMIKALYDTNDSILQSVAQRLYLFIKSSG